MMEVTPQELNVDTGVFEVNEEGELISEEVVIKPDQKNRRI